MINGRGTVLVIDGTEIPLGDGELRMELDPPAPDPAAALHVFSPVSGSFSIVSTGPVIFRKPRRQILTGTLTVTHPTGTVKLPLRTRVTTVLTGRDLTVTMEPLDYDSTRREWLRLTHRHRFPGGARPSRVRVRRATPLPKRQT